MAVRTIYLVRHGHYESWNNESVKGEGHITPIGRQQALSTSKRIAAIPFTAVYCSSLNRARETCELVVNGRPDTEIRTSTLLQEVLPVIPGRWEPFLKDYSQNDLVADRDRAEVAYSRHFISAVGKDKCDLIVAHGNLIRFFVCRVLDVDVKSWGYMDIDHCSISVVRINHNGWTQLVRLNDTAHLPDALVGSLPDGGLADKLWLTASDALKKGEIDNDRYLGRDALGIYYNMGSNKVPELKRWLEKLPD